MEATPSAPATDHAALLAARDKLAAAAGQARRRRSVTTAVLLVAVLAVVGYFGWAYSQLAQLDAPTLVAAVETQFEPVLQQRPEEIARYMEAQAPEVVEGVVELVKQAPGTLAEQGRAYLWQETDRTLAQLEDDLYQSIVAAVRQAKVEAQDRTGGEPVKPEDVQAMLADLAGDARTTIDAAITDAQQRYQRESADILGYLDHIAQGRELTPLDRLHRQIFVDFLALMEVWQQSGGDATVQPSILPTAN